MGTMNRKRPSFESSRFSKRIFQYYRDSIITYTFTINSARIGLDASSILKRILIGLNSGFYFSSADWHKKFKTYSLPYYLTIAWWKWLYAYCKVPSQGKEQKQNNNFVVKTPRDGWRACNTLWIISSSFSFGWQKIIITNWVRLVMLLFVVSLFRPYQLSSNAN